VLRVPRRHRAQRPGHGWRTPRTTSRRAPPPCRFTSPQLYPRGPRSRPGHG
jgi:hypothetical protein